MTQAGASPNPLDELVKLLAEDQSFTSIEIAEILWLAMQMESTTEVVMETSTPDPPPTSPVVPPDADVASEPEWEAPPSPAPEAPPRVDIATPSPQAGVLPPQTLPVWLADPAMLTDSLAVIRALRPLLQKVDAGPSKRLDEVATVDMIARTRLCLPVMAPNQEPWFDIVLVLDRGTSMHIWQRLVKDIVRILRRYGAFRDVQVYDLAVQPGAGAEPILLISNPQRPGHRTSELIDQRGRRIAIFLSDCAGAYWWNGMLLPMLQAWGKVMPTVVWQMLPPWMWKRTALGTGASVSLRNDLAGAANQRLQVHLPERDRPEDFDERLPLPVVTSEVADLARWSLMVAGDHRVVTPGFLLPQSGGLVPKAQPIEEAARDRAEALLDAGECADLETAIEQALEEIARDRVEQFLDFASPQAQRLMMLLAAAPVITLPVVRLIRDAMIYDARSPLPVAEVFLSGLLHRLPGQADADLDSAQLTVTALDALSSDSQDLVQYGFVPKVRQVLLDFLPEVDTLLVINSISAAVERRWNQYSEDDFQAFLRDPNAPVPAGLEGVRSFASITAYILEQLGGEYSDMAQELRQGSAAPSEDSQTEPADDWLSDFPLQDFEYEVAEYINFPPLETFDFIEAHFEDDEPQFPPPLQTEEFTIVSFSLDESSSDDLEQFEFSVATIFERDNPQCSVALPPNWEEEDWDDDDWDEQEISEGEWLDGNWAIDYQYELAYYFKELLPKKTILEMVAIPAGIFLMGSPENEIGRNEDESPQHEVKIQSFFMGRYLVTQSQWRVVAELPRYEHDLSLNPSHFKGDELPVERVSWQDAVEFCDRLSVYTGRKYRLPTEAEWEYACRAETDTPFHFGETISSNVANYQGNVAYANGPIGQDVGQTTYINYFEVANAFGLSDMHGNLREWCQDAWHKNYIGAPTDGQAWLSTNPQANRVVRGGAWSFEPQKCRSAARDSHRGVLRTNIGFRVVCSAI